MKLFLLFLPLFLTAQQITLEWLRQKPSSLPKDYYIWRYLHQNITPQEADSALQQAQRVTRKLFFAYAKKSTPQIQQIAQCMKMSAKELLKASPSCAAAGMNSYKLSTLSKKEIVLFLQKTAPFTPPANAKLLLQNHLSPAQFVRLFTTSAPSFRKKLDRYLKKSFVEQMAQTSGFSGFVKKIVFSKDYPKLSLSLLQLPATKLDATTAFYLALEAMKHKLLHSALSYLERSYNAYYQSQKDRVLFWLYRLTTNKNYLLKLASSWDINIYSLYAKEQLHQTPFFIIPEAKGQKDINISDPFIWLKLKRAKKEEFFYANTLPLYAYLLQKESHYHLHPYILPYKKLLKDQNNSQKALIYAIARQESRFIPGSISTSFALGLMQFMPFLARSYAKRTHMEHFDLDMMFDPKVALKFAKLHLFWLDKQLHDPLLIAYAYNGGIGFVKRKVLPLFQRYDPWLALELVPYSETREYGKKVLAHYYIYLLIFKKPFCLHRYFQKLASRFHNLGAKE